MSLNLRAYQTLSIEGLRAGFAAGHRSQILYAPTGAGKTEMAIALLEATKTKGNKAAMILDRIILCDQTSQRLQKYNIDHGVLQSGHWRYRPYESIQVCSAQTIEKRGSFPGLTLMIVDECFPAGTMISTPSGSIPINSVRCGDLVHNAIGVGQVLQVMARPAIELIRLEYEDGTVTECTANHPIFTERGWTKAGLMEVGQSVFSKQGMRLLWQTVLSTGEDGKQQESGGDSRVKVDIASSLLSILLKEVSQSDEQPSITLEDEGKTEGDTTQTNQARRKRSIAAVTATCFASRAGGGVGVGVCTGNENAPPQNWLSNLLQIGLGLPGKENGDRARWWQSWNTGEEGARFEKDRVLHFPRLVNSSIVKRASPEPVFNLHIDGHPSYFADGKLVHNCHATRKQTIDFIRDNPDIKVVGLSATPFTKGLGKVYENVVSTVTTDDLVKSKVLAPLRVFIAKEINMEGAKKVAGEWSQAESTERGMKITGDIVAEWISKTHEIFGKPRKTIVFCSGVEHGADLAKKFAAAGYNFISISYKDDEQFKKDVIEDFSKPDTEIHGLIATDILTKGFDVSDVMIGVSARPFSKSLSSHIQQMGRVMRGHEGKEYAVWLDHSGNYLRFQEEWEQIYEIGVQKLDDTKEKTKKEKTEKEKEAAKCPKCGAFWPSKSDTCLHCGHVRQRQNKVQNVSGQMQELVKGVGLGDKQDWWSMCQYKVQYSGWSAGRAAHTYREKFGHWPRGLVDVPKAPDVVFERVVRAALLKFIKGKR